MRRPPSLAFSSKTQVGATNQHQHRSEYANAATTKLAVQRHSANLALATHMQHTRRTIHAPYMHHTSSMHVVNTQHASKMHASHFQHTCAIRALYTCHAYIIHARSYMLHDVYMHRICSIGSTPLPKQANTARAELAVSERRANDSAREVAALRAELEQLRRSVNSHEQDVSPHLPSYSPA